MSKQVIIIGGGASGLAAAVTAARAGAQVTLLEKNDRVGKKLLATGNGRCNLSNERMESDCYRCGQKDFPMEVLARFGVKETLAFFASLGITTHSRNGYLYPVSDQASAVVDMLRLELAHLGVEVRTGCAVKEITVGGKSGGKRFLVKTAQGTAAGDAVILSAGSQAAPSTGSDGSGYGLARRLGHRLIRPLPALVQLRCEGKVFRQLAGVRCHARVRLMEVVGKKAGEIRVLAETGKNSGDVQVLADEGWKSGMDWTLMGTGRNTGDVRVLAEDTGELQLTDYGISGIPVFQVSRFASVALSQGKKVLAQIDFLPEQSPEETKAFLEERSRTLSYLCWGDFLTGLIHKKLAAVLLKSAGLNPADPVAAGADALNRLLGQLKFFTVPVTATNSFDQAQVCCGGIDTRQVRPETLESTLVEGLYLTGELLDVDGICGGYNLQWAWATGCLAGADAGKDCRGTSDAGTECASLGMSDAGTECVRLGTSDTSTGRDRQQVSDTGRGKT